MKWRCVTWTFVSVAVVIFALLMALDYLADKSGIKDVPLTHDRSRYECDDFQGQMLDLDEPDTPCYLHASGNLDISHAQRNAFFTDQASLRPSLGLNCVQSPDPRVSECAAAAFSVPVEAITQCCISPESATNLRSSYFTTLMPDGPRYYVRLSGPGFNITAASAAALSPEKRTKRVQRCANRLDWAFIEFKCRPKSPFRKV